LGSAVRLRAASSCFPDFEKPVESNFDKRSGNVANKAAKSASKHKDRPSMALNAVCPYYTMFPIDFPLSVLKRFTEHRLHVLDPFCGRGTTIFAARIKGHKAYGIDCSPIAIAIARAKLAETSEKDVVALAEEILGGPKSVAIPKGDFWEWAYAPSTLRQMCLLRQELRGLRRPAAQMLRAICLGALHGPVSKCPEQRSYFSNQMPRTFASKPDYSVKFWRERDLKPVAVDALQVIKRRAKRLELETLPKCVGSPKIYTADARLARGYAALPSVIDLIITSPPYYGMRTYITDQWLRNWFLGGPAEVPYREPNRLSHQSPEAFAESLSQVWDRVGQRLSNKGRMFVRFGAIPSRKRDSKEIMLASLENSCHAWKVHRIREADSAASGKRQACHMGSRIKSAAIEEHDYEIAFS
jgi:DNA modification methylase